MIRAAGAQNRKIWAPFGDMASEKELARIRRCPDIGTTPIDPTS